MASDPPPVESPAKPYKVSSFLLALGGLDLPQYRLKSVQDMSGLFMKTDTVDEFLDKIRKTAAGDNEKLAR